MHMVKKLAIGAAAGGGYLLADSFVPTTNNNMLDKAINLTIAGVVGILAMKVLKV